MASVLSKDKKSALREAKTYDFTWEATVPGGVEKKKGEMNAVSANVVRANLRRMGLMPTEVRKAPQPLFGERGVKEAQVVVMVRQLSTMINAGVPIVQSFELLVSATSGAGMKKLLTGILKHLKMPSVAGWSGDRGCGEYCSNRASCAGVP